VIQWLRSPLEKIAVPAVAGLVAFAINFDCGSGGAEPEQFNGMALPDEWQVALVGKSGAFPDVALDAVWPQ
jgi:hypothetical protein